MAFTQISTTGVNDDAVTSGKIPANAVGSSELADNAVDTAAIADDAVTDAKLANSINSAIAAALFANSTCIYVGMLNASLNVQNYDTCHHTFMYARGSTDATTYSLRVGVDGGTYEHINNMTYASNSEYNQLRHSSMTLMEASST